MCARGGHSEREHEDLVHGHPCLISDHMPLTGGRLCVFGRTSPQVSNKVVAENSGSAFAIGQHRSPHANVERVQMFEMLCHISWCQVSHPTALNCSRSSGCNNVVSRRMQGRCRDNARYPSAHWLATSWPSPTGWRWARSGKVRHAAEWHLILD